MNDLKSLSLLSFFVLSVSFKYINKSEDVS